MKMFSDPLFINENVKHSADSENVSKAGPYVIGTINHHTDLTLAN